MGRRGRLRWAANQAQQVLDEHGGRSGVVRGRKVDVHALLPFMGIQYSEKPLGNDTSGMCLIKNGRAAVVVNQDHHMNRKRFTAAHELGHYIMHSGEIEVFLDAHGDKTQRVYRNGQSSLGTDPMEVEANNFASALLMPAEAVQQAWSARVGNRFAEDQDVAQLARWFQVSRIAMSLRLQALRLL